MFGIAHGSMNAVIIGCPTIRGCDKLEVII